MTQGIERKASDDFDHTQSFDFFSRKNRELQVGGKHVYIKGFHGPHDVAVLFKFSGSRTRYLRIFPNFQAILFDNFYVFFQQLAKAVLHSIFETQN